MEAESACSSLTLKKISTNSSKQQSYCFPEPNCAKTQVPNSTLKFCLEYIFTKATSLMSRSTKITFGHCGHLHLNFWHPHLEEKKSILRHLPQETNALHKYPCQHPFNTISRRKRAAQKQHPLRRKQLRQPEQTPSFAKRRLRFRAVLCPTDHLAHPTSKTTPRTPAITH